MRKISLVVGAKAIEPNLEDTRTRLEIEDVFKKYPPEASTNPINFRINAIIKYLDNTNDNLIIGNAVETIREYLSLKKELLKRKIVIDQIIIKIPEYSEEDLVAFYNQQPSRREYSLPEIEQLAKAHQERRLKLVKKIEEDEIKVIYITSS